jgi:hypothetical protein
MSKYGLFSSEGKQLQQYEGDYMHQDKQFVYIMEKTRCPTNQICRSPQFISTQDNQLRRSAIDPARPEGTNRRNRAPLSQVTRPITRHNVDVGAYSIESKLRPSCRLIVEVNSFESMGYATVSR